MEIYNEGKSMKKQVIGIFPNLEKDLVRQELPKFVALCKEEKLDIVLPHTIAAEYNTQGYDTNEEESLKGMTAAITLGGDGTILRATPYIAPLGIPLLGINLGRLGFLTEVGLGNMDAAICRMKKEYYTVEKRSMLQAEVWSGRRKILKAHHAINEVVLAGSNVSRLTHLTVKINGQHSANYPSDGLIIATATGSTSYSLSAGGPIIHPSLDVSLITPICAHALHARPMVIPMTDKVELEPCAPYGDIFLSTDGLILCSIKPEHRVVVQKSPYAMNFIRFGKDSYYETWQNRLLRKEESGVKKEL